MIKTFFTKRVAMGVTRHLATTFGGYLIAQGMIDAAAAEALTGASIAIAGVAFSIWEKRF